MGVGILLCLPDSYRETQKILRTAGQNYFKKTKIYAPKNKNRNFAKFQIIGNINL